MRQFVHIGILFCTLFITACVSTNPERNPARDREVEDAGSRNTSDAQLKTAIQILQEALAISGPQRQAKVDKAVQLVTNERTQVKLNAKVFCAGENVLLIDTVPACEENMCYTGDTQDAERILKQHSELFFGDEFSFRNIRTKKDQISATLWDGPNENSVRELTIGRCPQ